MIGNIRVCASMLIFATMFSGQAMAQSCKTVWQPTESSLCNANWGIARRPGATHPASLDDRLSCVNNAPGNGGAALKFVMPANIVSSLMDYAKKVDGLASTHVRTETYVYIPANYKYFSAGRMAMGVRIGNPNKPGNCHSGGCPPEDQDGASVRVNYRLNSGKTTLTPAIYSYHLNRGGTPLYVNGKKKVWGANNHMSKPLPEGQWVKMVLEVKLNDIGKSNGFSKLTTYNQNGSLISTVTTTNAKYRNSAQWKIMGPIMTEKVNAGKSPVTQSMYYKDYKMQNCD